MADQVKKLLVICFSAIRVTSIQKYPDVAHNELNSIGKFTTIIHDPVCQSREALNASEEEHFSSHLDSTAYERF